MSERKILNIFKLKNLIKIIFNPHLIIIRLLYNLKRFSSDIMAKFGRYKHKYNIIFIAGNKVTDVHENCPPCVSEPCEHYWGIGDKVLELPAGDYKSLYF